MNLKQAVQNGDELSPLLLKELNQLLYLNPENPYQSLIGILMLMDLTSKLGWVEHTSDWDIGAFIFLKNGNKIDIQPGYGDSLTLHLGNGSIIPTWLPGYHSISETKDFTLQLTEHNCDSDEPDVYPISINIWDILAIKFFD